MVETRAQAMANERLDKLDESIQSINKQLTGLSLQVQQLIPKDKEPAHEEAYNGHEYHEGESSHSHHVWHTHPPPSQRPPKLDMHKFDGSHTSAWLAQMEQYFQLNHIIDEGTKLMVGTMYLDSERWQWKEWYQRCNAQFQNWGQFAKALRNRFEQEDSFLGRLTKLRQTGTMDEYITAFEALAFYTKGLIDEFYMECFINGLK